MKTKLGLIVLFSLITTLTFAQILGSRNLHFVNQRGSALNLIGHPGKIKNTGTITGTFKTAVGDCKTDIGKPQAILGYYNYNAIAATVNFPHCQQIAVITGNLDKQDTIHVLWLDIKNAPQVAKSQWKANVVGADVYRKVKS